MLKIKHVLLFCICHFLIACSQNDSTKVFDQQQAAILLQRQHQLQPTKQMIKLALPNKNAWQRIDLSYGTVGSPMMLIPITESSDNWTQSIRTQIAGYRHQPTINARKFVANLVTEAQARCTYAQGKVITEQHDFIIYQLNLMRCKDEKDQTQIGKAFNGEDAVYLVYYSALDGKVTHAQLQQNTRIIQTARLITSAR